MWAGIFIGRLSIDARWAGATRKELMEKKIVDGIMGIIEDLDAENLALKSRLMSGPHRLSQLQVDSLVAEARALPSFQDLVSARWKKLRDRLQSDTNLEAALREFAKIVPPPKDVN